MFHESITTCEVCDMVNEIPPLKDGERFRCVRCSHVLVSVHKHALSRIIATGCSALLMLALALSFSFLSFSSNGAERSMRLIDCVTVLLSHGYLLMGSLLSLALFVFPLFYLCSVIYLAWSFLFLYKTHPLQKYLAHWFVVVQPWLMVDVFLIGVLVALVKMSSMADIQLGLSFWAFCGYVILLIKTVVLVDKRWIWNRAAGHGPKHVLFLPKSARKQGLIGCHSCGATLDASAHHCSRCGHSVHSRRPASLMITSALLVSALVMYIPANFFPIMQTTFLGSSEPSTIMGGVLLLWSLGSYPVALIIFVASIVIPIAKIASLIWLCWQCYYPSQRGIKQKMMLYKMTEFVGRWSMIDIFVVAVLTSLVQLGNLISILPGIAVISFASVVILTMWAALIFDSRLLWDQHDLELESSELEQ